MTAGAFGAAPEAATDRRQRRTPARPPQLLRASAATVPSERTCPLATNDPPSASAASRAAAASNATPRHLSEHTAETAAITDNTCSADNACSAGSISGASASERSHGAARRPARLPRLIVAAAPKRPDHPAGLTLRHRDRARASSTQSSTSSAKFSKSPAPGTGGTTGGAVISAVSPHSPFHPHNALRPSDALQIGDEMLTVNGHRVRDPRRAARMIRSAGGSGCLKVLVSRGERPEGTSYHLARVGGGGGGKDGNGGGNEGSRWKESKLDEGESRWKEAKDGSGSIALGEDNANACGINFQPSTNGALVRVQSVSEESPFRKTGLRAGDIVLSVDGIPVQSASDADDLLNGNDNTRSNLTLGSTFARSVQTGHDGSRVAALLVYSPRDLRRRALKEALFPHEGSANLSNEEAAEETAGEPNGAETPTQPWQVAWLDEWEGREGGECVILRMPAASVAFRLDFDAEGTCACEAPYASSATMGGPRLDGAPFGEDAEKEDGLAASHASCDEARAALEWLCQTQIRPAVDALNCRTGHRLRRLAEAVAASRRNEGEGGSAAASMARHDGATVSAASGLVAGDIGESRRPMHPPVDEDGSSPTCSSPPPPAQSDSPEERSLVMVDDAGEPSGEALAMERSEDGPLRPGLPRDSLTLVRRAAKETSEQIAALGNGKCEHRPEPTDPPDPPDPSSSMAPLVEGHLLVEEGEGTVEPQTGGPGHQNGDGVRRRPVGGLRRRPSVVPVYAKRRRSAGTVPSALTESESESSDGETSSSSSYATTSSSEESAEDLPRPAKKQGRAPRQRQPRRETAPPRQLAAPASNTTDMVVYQPEAADRGRRNSAPALKPPQPHHKHRLKLRNADIRRRYKVLPTVLGEGAFGTVRACFHRGTHEKLAVKSIPKRGNVKNAALLKNEIALVQRADHPNIVKVQDVIQDKEYIHIVMEECRGGDLFDRIVEGGVRLTEERACEIIGCLLDALAYLHDRSIVHRDLKAEHLMLSREDIRSPVKIIDFGLATIHGPDDPPMTAFAGSAFTVAPEVIARKYGKECDLWSVGVIAYFLLTQKMPFNAQSDNDIFQKIVRCDYGYPLWTERGLSEAAKDFIDRLLVVDPRRRLTARQALSHVWIRRQNRRHEASLNSLELALVPFAEAAKAIVVRKTPQPREHRDQRCNRKREQPRRQEDRNRSNGRRTADKRSPQPVGRPTRRSPQPLGGAVSSGRQRTGRAA